eukprot:6189044-Pleurochrysis_carterae.AAC.3
MMNASDANGSIRVPYSSQRFRGVHRSVQPWTIASLTFIVLICIYDIPSLASSCRSIFAGHGSDRIEEAHVRRISRRSIGLESSPPQHGIPRYSNKTCAPERGCHDNNVRWGRCRTCTVDVEKYSVLSVHRTVVLHSNKRIKQPN